ncbi:hypothetical protein GW17_00027842, partial [Ensete ventricosum]
MILLYRMYSELISSSIAEGGPFASKTSFVKLLRYGLPVCLYRGVMMEYVPRIFEAVFQCTLEVRTMNLRCSKVGQLSEILLRLAIVLPSDTIYCQVSEFCNQFYRTYYLTIEQEIFAVLTDTFHKPGFKLHVIVLQHLFCLVRGKYIITLFCMITQFVGGLFESRSDLPTFKNHIRDFLVQSKEFSAQVSVVADVEYII